MAIYQLKSGKKDKTYRENNFSTKSKLVNYLKNNGLNIEILNNLKGGVDSSVYNAMLGNRSVVVKSTEDRGLTAFAPPFSEIDFFVDRKNHNVDTNILKILRRNKVVKVPEVLHFFPDKNVTVMENLEDSGYKLMLNEILDRKFSINSAKAFGTALGKLVINSKLLQKIKFVKNPEIQFFERGLELRMLYPNTQERYLELRKQYTNNCEFFLWADAHPKNIFTKDSEVAFIDFGGTYFGDVQFLLPNFFGQLYVYVNSGHISNIEFVEYLRIVVEEFEEVTSLKINEAVFCKYFGMEPLHRSCGKWIISDDSSEKKIKNIKFGLKIFDNKIFEITALLEHIENL